MPLILRRLLVALSFVAGLAAAQEAPLAAGPHACRIAFDMGSSGIRAGASDSERSARRELDALGPLWAGQGIASIEPAVIRALRELPAEAALDDTCRKVGGGFSAWRLALEQDPAGLVASLRRIDAAAGVTVLVMPPAREGSYGFFAVRQTLGRRFATSHALDIGGGSLQVAGERQSFAAALGQKSWHRLLCERLRNSTAVPCALQPMDDRDLTRARALLAVRLAGNGLPADTTMTAISRPVTRGVAPAVRHLDAGSERQPDVLLGRDVTRAIAQLAGLDLAATMARTQAPPGHAAFLLSDLILVEGLLALSADRRLRIAEADFTNLPGLLADDRAFAWHDRYACYLQRLQEQGIAAYASDPASCPAAGAPH